MAGFGGVSRAVIVVGLLGMVTIGSLAGSAVAAERTVLGEYFTATW